MKNKNSLFLIAGVVCTTIGMTMMRGNLIVKYLFLLFGVLFTATALVSYMKPRKR